MSDWLLSHTRAPEPLAQWRGTRVKTTASGLRRYVIELHFCPGHMTYSPVNLSFPVCKVFPVTFLFFNLDPPVGRLQHQYFLAQPKRLQSHLTKLHQSACSPLSYDYCTAP